LCTTGRIYKYTAATSDIAFQRIIDRRKKISKPKQVRERTNPNKSICWSQQSGVCVSCDSVSEWTESLGVCRLFCWSWDQG